MIVAILTFYYKKTCQNITDTLSCSPIKQEYPQMLQHLRVFGFPVFKNDHIVRLHLLQMNYLDDLL